LEREERKASLQVHMHAGQRSATAFNADVGGQRAYGIGLQQRAYAKGIGCRAARQGEDVRLLVALVGKVGAQFAQRGVRSTVGGEGTGEAGEIPGEADLAQLPDLRWKLQRSPGGERRY